MADTFNTTTTGSRLPAEVLWSGAPSGLGLSPDLNAIAGTSTGPTSTRPQRAVANDAAFDHGEIMDGRYQGEVHPLGENPCL